MFDALNAKKREDIIQLAAPTMAADLATFEADILTATHPS